VLEGNTEDKQYQGKPKRQLMDHTKQWTEED